MRGYRATIWFCGWTELTAFEGRGGEESRFEANKPRRADGGEYGGFRDASDRISGTDRWPKALLGGCCFRVSSGDELNDLNPNLLSS